MLIFNRIIIFSGEDFHQFSCGSFIKKKRIPDEQNKIDVFDILRNEMMHSVSVLLSEDIDENEINSTKNAKRLYHSCMDEELINKNSEQEFRTLLDEEFGGWPILDLPTVNTSKREFERPILEKLIKLRRIGFKSLIEMHVTLNPKDPTLMILKIKQPLWFFNKHYYSDVKFLSAYEEYMSKYVLYLNKNLKAEQINEQISNMIELEKLFAMVNKFTRPQHKTLYLIIIIL